jgi:hypothetical protein
MCNMKRGCGWIGLMCCLLAVAVPAWGQSDEGPINMSLNSTYRVAGLTVLGAEYTDVQAVTLFSALQVGTEIEIPGDAIRRAIVSRGTASQESAARNRRRSRARLTC